MDIDKEKVRDELAMLKGDPPHNVPHNACYGDGYYAAQLSRRYGMSISELEQACDYANRRVCDPDVDEGMTVSEMRRLLASMPQNAKVCFDSSQAAGMIVGVEKLDHMPSRTVEAGYVVLS